MAPYEYKAKNWQRATALVRAIQRLKRLEHNTDVEVRSASCAAEALLSWRSCRPLCPMHPAPTTRLVAVCQIQYNKMPRALSPVHTVRHVVPACVSCALLVTCTHHVRTCVFTQSASDTERILTVLSKDSAGSVEETIDMPNHRRRCMMVVRALPRPVPSVALAVCVTRFHLHPRHCTCCTASTLQCLSEHKCVFICLIFHCSGAWHSLNNLPRGPRTTQASALQLLHHRCNGLTLHQFIAYYPLAFVNTLAVSTHPTNRFLFPLNRCVARYTL